MKNLMVLSTYALATGTLLALQGCADSLPTLPYADGSKRIPINVRVVPIIERQAVPTKSAPPAQATDTAPPLPSNSDAKTSPSSNDSPKSGQS